MTTSAIRHWKSLVSKGYFPEELPPCFTSEDLADIVSEEDFDIAVFTNKKWAKLINFSIPRVKGARRILSIPNPYYYVKISHEIADNLPEIKKLLAKSKLSAFKLAEPSDSRLRYIEKPDFDRFKEARILRSVGFRYLLLIDINRFYHSIYTHSIVWAVHSKALAKEIAGKKSEQTKYFGCRIDSICMCLQDGQTMGVPIGPDTSRLLAELLLAAVDREIQTTLPGIRGIRNVDDYYLYFKTLGDLEVGRSVIQRALKGFELELNGIKDTVIELPESLQREWYTVISEFSFRKDINGQKKDLLNFFDKSFHFARLNPDDNIISYSIAKLNGLVVREENWEVLQSCLLNSIVLESKAISHVVYQLLRYTNEIDYSIDESIVSDAFETFLHYHLELQHHFEISWALWYVGEASLKLGESLCEKLNGLEHPLLILQVLHLEKQKLLFKKLNKEKWLQLISGDSLMGEYWILAYEASANKWLKSSTVSKHDFFSHLAAKEVKFFKPDQELEDAPVVYGSRGSMESHRPPKSSPLLDEDDDHLENLENEELEDLDF